MTPEVRLLGIDPGLTGALALLGLAPGGPSLTVADMPEVHKTIDAAALAAL